MSDFGPLIIYGAFVPFAASLWADIILTENRRDGIKRISLLWWSCVVGVLWPLCLGLAVIFGMAWLVAIVFEWLGKTRFGRWLDQDVRP